MNLDPVPVPFIVPDLYEGLADAHGLLRCEGDTLTLEFEVRDSLMGVVKSGLKTVRVGLDQLVSIEYIRRWWGTRLVLRARTLEPLQEFPNFSAGTIRLKIARANRDIARKFAGEVNYRLAVQDTARLAGD